MKSTFYPPSQKTSPLVRIYISMINDNNECTDKFVPDGNLAIVFNFFHDDKFVEGESKFKLPPYFITTPLIKSLKFNSSSLIDSLIVVCNSTVFTKLFKLKLVSSLSKPFQEVDLFYGYQLYNKLKSFETTEERVSFLDSFIEKTLFVDEYIPDEIDIIYNQIMASKGETKISILMNDIKMNSRSFRRNFMSRVGLSAKELLRIVRVNYVWSLYKNNPAIELKNVMYQCHFFDQAHFINDFKKIVGETPRDFLNRELDKVEFISGRQNISNQALLQIENI